MHEAPPIAAPGFFGSITTAMQFDSLLFIVGFVGFAWAMQTLRPTTSQRNFALLLVSYGFYSTWSPLYVPFLFGSTLLDYWVSQRIAASDGVVRRRSWLCVSLVVNLSLLGWFKYADFAREVVCTSVPGLACDALTSSVGAGFVPLGISFFTFQTISYSVDVYRRELPPSRSLVEFALYVSFFPQLVAGPIVRAGEMLPQLRCSPNRAEARDLDPGWELVVLGLFQKVVLSDGVFRPVVETVFDGGGAAATQWDHWLAVYSFWGQLYCDFSGYSNMAIGMAACLGFRLPQNFNCPYAAQSLAEFWRRWHMTLTRWIGAYLYRPLGGRHCRPLRSTINVIVVMSLVGLWHGASWTFVVWGFVHALALVVERIGKAACRKAPWRAEFWGAAPLRAFVVFLFVGQSCVLFRAHDLPHARALARAMYSGVPGESAVGSPLQTLLCSVTLAGLFGCQWYFRERDLTTWIRTRPARRAVLAWAMAFVAICLVGHTPTGYLYFQF